MTRLTSIGLVVIGALCSCTLSKGRSLLDQGKAEQVLQVVRPRGAAAYRLRARALRSLGRLNDAQTELRISVELDPGSAEGHRLLGQVETSLGNKGAALLHFEQSLQSDPQQPKLREAVGRLLIERALKRDRLLGGLERRQRASVSNDLQRAADLAPQLSSVVAKLRVSKIGKQPVSDCLADSATSLPVTPERCQMKRAERFLRRLQARQLLVGCAGHRLARRLEVAGCREQAFATWRALSAETPTDPRPRGEQFRLRLLDGEHKKAALLLTDYLFWTAKPFDARMDAARLYVKAGHLKLASWYAVQALAMASNKQQRIAVVQFLRRIDPNAAREAEAFVR